MLKKEYTYSRKAADEAVAILRRTVLRRNRMISLVCALLMAAGVTALGVSGGNVRMYILAAVVLLLEGYVLWNRGEEKSAAFALSPEGGQKYWSAERTLELEGGLLTVRAAYSDPDDIISESNRRDEEYMKLHRELEEEMSVMTYPLFRLSCAESDGALLIYHPWKGEYLPLLKEWFDGEELALLTARLQEVMGRRYRRL